MLAIGVAWIGQMGNVGFYGVELEPWVLEDPPDVFRFLIED